MTTFVYENSSGQLVDWPRHSFSTLDLNILDQFLKDKDVVPLFDIVDDEPDPLCVAMRHDVDHSIEHALKFAQWEHARGYRSTYFVLHTAWYYRNDWQKTVHYAKAIQAHGHEIGFHNDSIGEALRRNGNTEAGALAKEIIYDELEKWVEAGFDMRGIADHGGGYPELQAYFWEKYQPRDFGFEYEAYQLMAGQNYISDNRGKWNAPLQVIEGKQTHMLVHPCHWPLNV